MPKPRKKKVLTSSTLPGREKRRKRISDEDLVGRLLGSTFGAIITAVISLAKDGQINWLWVIVVFCAVLLVTVLYQRWKK